MSPADSTVERDAGRRVRLPGGDGLEQFSLLCILIASCDGQLSAEERSAWFLGELDGRGEGVQGGDSARDRIE